MDSGAYRKKILIQKCVSETDTIGQSHTEWITWKKLYAYVNGLSGREYWEAARTQAENTVDFLLRWHSFMNEITTSEYRIVMDGGIYDIKTIDNIRFENKIMKIRAISKEGKAI